MSVSKFSISIEGDYVDSYIYSGFLVLVDIDYNLSIYKWEKLIASGLKGVDLLKSLSLRSLMIDSRNSIPKNSLIEVVISKENLNSAKLFAHEIGVWPSDINVYSNKLFISSENGVARLSLDYNTGSLDNEIKLFDEMCFSLSPNSFGRLAFAAGKEGVFTLIPLSQFHNRSDVKQLINETCMDLDWQSTKLLAQTNQGVIEATYSSMPSKGSFDEDKAFFNAVKVNKKVPTKIITNTNVQASWIAGDKLYSLKHDGGIKVINLKNDNSEFEFESTIDKKLLRARTAAFGTVLETNDELIGLIGNEKIHLANEPVSWRVFPRAKNYANQLHVIQDDRLEITIIESTADNNYGFDTEKIDQQG
jgi:hypothetical protein